MCHSRVILCTYSGGNIIYIICTQIFSRYFRLFRTCGHIHAMMITCIRCIFCSVHFFTSKVFDFVFIFMHGKGMRKYVTYEYFCDDISPSTLALTHINPTKKSCYFVASHCGSNWSGEPTFRFIKPTFRFIAHKHQKTNHSIYFPNPSPTRNRDQISHSSLDFPFEIIFLDKK